ncbi:G-type lectin S-receptor-like serine/threonine-protein kinase At5g35370 [Impatiens glandulifera]|uniref:G-type lectin S-receptor-like serine/threonine-protein kinase At5g35370 n=1 Tax=Impatiens glandulifera TaxID=253017 RepID=UPI001FB0C45D|nr:G-type lectin S-receptor-like serine/threonine-protein kinase At5g35370 [Impatiens glandulifera]
MILGSALREFIYPNFTASNFHFIDNSGTFLFSKNGTFEAAIFNPANQQTNFYLCIIHSASNTIIWSANRDAAVTSSGKMSLTADGININDADGQLKWSTPSLPLPVLAMKLTDEGNLVLLDQFNRTLWDSFSNPTDTIVIGQKLAFGTWLSSYKSNVDFSTGDYNLTLSSSDLLLQWKNNNTYWKLSMDTRSFIETTYAVEYMTINQTGLYLVGRNGSSVVIQVNLSPSEFRIAKLDLSGQFIISTFSGKQWKNDFSAPFDQCRIPFICGMLGLCSSSSNSHQCSCPPNLHVKNSGACSPTDPSFSFPSSSSCNSTNSSDLSYVSLGYGIDYFSIDFTPPVKTGVSVTSCQDICTHDCVCFGIFYVNSSGSCFVIENQMGSVISSHGNSLGFIKTSFNPSTVDENRRREIPVVLAVLLPFSLLLLLAAVCFLWWRRSEMGKNGDGLKFGSQPNSPPSESDDDLEAFSIPGLPIRFTYSVLEKATDNFKTQIGSGGFGSVYKCVLPDKTLAAVKKITNLGIQGKKDFCTEIAVIGNIRHANLVKLRGFCAQGRQRLLVYEYMNRGSLDHTLFGSGPALEWQERVDIALGAARGLAYLHCGCDHKIIHCDVKPENILLHDRFLVKISDFGLSKLLSPEESGLFTTMRGTRGYLAPEWLTNSAISEKTDVYSFGMVLLEMVSSRKNCLRRTQSHNMISDGHNNSVHSSSSSIAGLLYFPLFALEMHEQGRYEELVDRRLEGRVSGEEVGKMVKVALCCVHEEPSLRPSMVTVVAMLEGKIPPGEPIMESLNFLRFYGRRFTEASMMEGNNNDEDELFMYSRLNASITSTRSSNSPASYSFISSQQVSGPR